MTSQSRTFELGDRYHLLDGTVFMTGLQALVRLPMDVARLDRRAGRRTAGYVTGYQGSPLAGYDLELSRWSAVLSELDVLVRPCLNEELAANGVMGTQHASASPRRVNDGVVGYWYGKAPGLDRATDALRHGNLGGAHPQGGALVIVGDDVVAKSSTVPSSSELALADLGMSILSPADAQDVLDLGVHAVLMSRFSGLWSALKIATNVADGGTIVHLSPDRIQPVIPDNEVDGVPYIHEVSAHFLQPRLGPLERSLVHQRSILARRYAVANGLNRRLGAQQDVRFGIIVAGTAYLESRQALLDLGIGDEDLDRLGIAILKLGMVHPLDPDQIRSFAQGLDEILVVEEKRSFIEAGVKEILFGVPGAPAVTGKRSPDGTALLRSDADLPAGLIARALRLRLGQFVNLPKEPDLAPVPRASLPLLQRTPYFCSGCPHNRSTRNPDSTLVGGGIGCHTMVMNLPTERIGNLIGFSQMGGEGAMWAGMEPFVTDDHLVQNLGDGTFHHSGSLAIRAAVAAGSNMTFRLLYNSVVAMTGGQEAVGVMSVPNLVQSLRAEGVRRVVITTDNPGKYQDLDLPMDVDVFHRDRLPEVQAELVATAGVTVLINDEECATELRRRRKRGLAPAPRHHIFINERVCEGCGDCGQKSNCLSVQPVMTEYGRKTRIHQASCNEDQSCLRGECPSFLTVVPAAKRRRRRQTTSTPRPTVPDLGVDELPMPSASKGTDVSVRITGIGGTGVVTVSQVLSVAAAMRGTFVQSLDQTGLAQKGGAVVSDLRFCDRPIERSNRIGPGQVDLYLGCDLLVAAAEANLEGAHPDRTYALISTSQVATGAMVVDPDVTFPPEHVVTDRLGQRSRAATLVDARTLSTDLFADDQYANVLMVGMAVQLGLLPLAPQDVETALTLNGVAVARNHQAFRRGRQFIADPQGLQAAIALTHAPPPTPPLDRRAAEIAGTVRTEDPGLADLVLRRVGDLIAYQGPALARTYAHLVERVRAAEYGVDPASTRLSTAVATFWYKLLAYKDEYEVARLSIDPILRHAIEDEFGAGASFSFLLQPPFLQALGLKRKLPLPRSMSPVLWLLARMKFLRGTPVDPFGLARVRRIERALIVEYRQAIEVALAAIGDGVAVPQDRGPHQDGPAGIRPNVQVMDEVIALAELPDLVRGYEHVKLRNVNRYRGAMAEALARLQAAQAAGSTNAPQYQPVGSAN